MSWPSLHRYVLPAVAALFVLNINGARANQDANGTQKPLVPCLAVAADGTPIMPGTTLPSSRKVTVGFQLPADDASKVLKSRWVALVGNTEGDIAENTLEIKGQKKGWLRLTLPKPAPAGKYRLYTTLDDKPWQTLDFTVIEQPKEGRAEKPADLVPLEPGKTMNYDMVIRPEPGTKVDLPGVTPEADGTLRTTIGMKIGTPEDAGTPYELSINNQPVGSMWVKVDEKGMQAYRAKEGSEVKDLSPPRMIYPLPPKLEDCTEWTVKTDKGGEQKLILFGPMTIDGPSGPATGYLILSEEQTAAGSPGEEAVRGKDTIERYFVPKVGLVREVQVDTLAGKRTTRREIKLAGGGDLPYTIEPDPAMKGRLGRIQVAFPPDTKAGSAHVGIFKGEPKPGDKPSDSGYGAENFELMPGKYVVAVNGKRVPVEVKSGHRTSPKVGVLRIHAGSSTKSRVLDADGKTELWGDYGEADVTLPIGDYFLDIGGSKEPVKIEQGKVTEF